MLNGDALMAFKRNASLIAGFVAFISSWNLCLKRTPFCLAWNATPSQIVSFENTNKNIFYYFDHYFNQELIYFLLFYTKGFKRKKIKGIS